MMLLRLPFANFSRPILSKSTQPSRVQPNVTRHRTLGMTAVVLALAGCVTATQPLWRNTLEAPSTALVAGLAVNPTGEAYQLFTLNGALYLRKLGATGEEQWRQVINENGGDITSPKIVATDTDVFVTPTPTSILHIGNDGQQTTFTAAPNGPVIHEIEATAEGSLLVSYSEGVAELGSGGEERWRYEWPTAAETRLVRLATGNTLIARTPGNGNTAQITLLDAQGNLVREDSIPLTDTRSTLVQGAHGQFLVHGYTITRLSDEGSPLWSQRFEQAPTCTGGDNGEAACWFYQGPVIFPPYSHPGHASITWLNADGSIKSTYAFNELFPMMNRIEALYYNGNHHWTLQKFTMEPVNLLSSSSPPKHYHYISYSVLSEAGFSLKNINMTPAVYQDSGVDNPVAGYSKDGDVVAATVIRQGKLFSSGNTRLSRQGFVSSYTVP